MPSQSANPVARSAPSLLHYIIASLLRLRALRRPCRLHLRGRRPIRSRSTSRLVPEAPYRRTNPSARRHRIPSRARVPHILALAQEIEHERNTREYQQQIDERTWREMYGVVKDPGQQQDHSYNDEHGASNHPRHRRSKFRSPCSISSKVCGLRLIAGPEEILRRAALCSDRCIGRKYSAQS